MKADGGLLPNLFEAQVARGPDAVAVVRGTETLTYLDLDVRANRLAHHLIRRGAGPGRLVAVLADRSVHLLVGLLAVVKSGAGYVPISAGDPAPRVDHILADSGAVLVITTSDPASAANLSRSDRAIVLDTPEVEAALAGCPVTAPTGDDRVRPISGSDTAYVIYTSGSTGQPKGVVVGHDALRAYLAHAVAHYPSVAGRTLLHSSVSFDMTVTSLYAPLITGGTVVVADLHAALSGAERLPPEWRPTFLKVTPSHLAVLRQLPQAYSPTEELVIGGEALTGSALELWRRDHPAVAVVNEYGPTEATVGCCFHRVEPGEPVPAAVPIGVPTGDTRMYIVDSELRPVAEGELCIAGTQLAGGYRNHPELTRSRFVPNPFGDNGELMYRTGDLVRRSEDGNLVFLGRLDDQVKINGYRIEPGEVEAVLLDSGLVTQARVAARDGRGVRLLVAYVVTSDGELDVDDLRAHVAARLPDYMIPSSFVVLDTLPLTPNGKLDHGALAAPVRNGPGLARDPREAVLCGIASTLLGIEEVDADADFISLGGNSITAARLVTRARKEGLDITLMDVLRKRTVRAILAARPDAGRDTWATS